MSMVSLHDMTAAMPRHESTAAHMAATASGATKSQERRRTLWYLLLHKHHDIVMRRDWRPENLVIGNELGREILREGVTGRVLTPLAELLELGPTQLAPVIGVDRTTARRYAREDQAAQAQR
jgi:hypothetical protein